MRIIKVTRKTKREPRYHRKMGRIVVSITRIRKTFLGLPYKTLHKYRETYHGKVKDVDDCDLKRT